VNKSEAVYDLIARAPSIVRMAREGDQNSLAIIDQTQIMAKSGDRGAKAIYDAMRAYIRGEGSVEIGASRKRAPAKRLPTHAHTSSRAKVAPKAQAQTFHEVYRKAGTSVLAPTGKSSAKKPHKHNQNQNQANQGSGSGDSGGGDSGGGDSGGGDSGGDYGSDDTDTTDDTDSLDPVSQTASLAGEGDRKALGTVQAIFADAHRGDPRARSLAESIQEYTRSARLKGKGAVATVVGLANGLPLSNRRVSQMAAQFGHEGLRRAFIAGFNQPHASLPELTPEQEKCVRLGQCVGIARNLQVARQQRSRLSSLHPLIGWEAGEEI
jgi:hypothetical protein